MTQDSDNSKHMHYLYSIYPNAPYSACGSAVEVLTGYAGVDYHWLQTYTTSLILGVHWGWYA